jgi:hypothetical protein
MDLLFSVESNGIKGQFLSNNETSNPASTVALSSGVRFKFPWRIQLIETWGYKAVL